MDSDERADEAWLLGVQRKLYQLSRNNPDSCYRELWNWATDLRNIRCAWRKIAVNKGSRTAGPDGMTVERIRRGEGSVRFLTYKWHPKFGWMPRVEIPKRRRADLRYMMKRMTKRATTARSLTYLLRKLNPVLRGWGHFYRFCTGASQIFASLDYYVGRPRLAVVDEEA